MRVRRCYRSDVAGHSDAADGSGPCAVVFDLPVEGTDPLGIFGSIPTDHDADAGGTFWVFLNDWLRSSRLLLRLVLPGSFPLATAFALTHTFLPGSCRDGDVLALHMGGFSPIAMDAEGDPRRELSFEWRCVRRDAVDGDAISQRRLRGHFVKQPVCFRLLLVACVRH